jgi:hypothetical protein
VGSAAIRIGGYGLALLGDKFLRILWFVHRHFLIAWMSLRFVWQRESVSWSR